MATITKLVRKMDVLVVLVLLGLIPGQAQVSPAEVTHPQVKSLERTYFPQLIALNRDIGRMQFPFPFVLSRYIGLDAKDEAGADRRGLEFVMFHGRTVLKLSGNYNAAFNANLLTDNQRANRVLDEVIVPLLQLETDLFPPNANFAAYGIEIAWHVRRNNRSYDYEGAEIFTLLLNKSDALAFLETKDQSLRQDILSRSEMYLNGKEFGLALGERDPYPVTEAETAAAHPPESAMTPPSPAGNPESRSTTIVPSPKVENRRTETKTFGVESPDLTKDPDPKPQQPDGAAAEATPPDVDSLQKSCQKELDALAKEGELKFAFVNYAPPSFVVFQNRIFLQVTMRNPSPFNKDTTSIYKRAAQSFDLFLAPILRPLLDQTPQKSAIAGLDITVINQLNSNSAPSSEALEFICTLSQLHQFLEAKITNQDFINQSIVLVNGVRISLVLQQLE